MKKEVPASSFQQFEALFKYASIGIIVTGSKGEIMDINDFAEKQFGYKRKELKNKKIELLIPAKYKQAHTKHRSNFYHHPEVRSMGTNRDLFALKKNGKTFPVEISLSPYQLGGELFVIAFIIDIGVRKNNEKTMLEQKAQIEKIAGKLKILNAQLEKKVNDRTKMLHETLHELEISKDELSESLKKEKELGDLKSGFVTMASHEFRTPLSTILSSASLIGKYAAAEEQEKREKHINRIKNAVDGMKSILEDFLSLGKLEEGSVSAKIELITSQNLIENINSCINDMNQLCKHGQKIIFAEKGNGELETDLHLLKNILINLISNAIKFSHENSQIIVTAVLNKKELVLSIEDKGIGISEEDQLHLFERFFRARNTSNIQGTGLGLHIVAKYLELMDGKIKMESKLNEGTKFIIQLPRYY